MWYVYLSPPPLLAEHQGYPEREITHRAVPIVVVMVAMAIAVSVVFEVGRQTVGTELQTYPTSDGELISHAERSSQVPFLEFVSVNLDFAKVVSLS